MKEIKFECKRVVNIIWDQVLTNTRSVPRTFIYENLRAKVQVIKEFKTNPFEKSKI